MNNALEGQIAELDGKQAIHYLTLIASGAPFSGGGDDGFLSMVIDDARRRADALGLALPVDFDAVIEDAVVEGVTAGPVAQAFLHHLAETGEGEALVLAALEQAPTQTADFGLLTGPVLFIFVWLALAGDIDIKIGGVKYRKKGLSGAEQVALGKKFLPAALKLLS